MKRHVTGILGLSVASVVAGMGSVQSAQAATLSGTLQSNESLVSTQINVTTSNSADGGGNSGPSNEAGPTATSLTQLSNAYAYIDNTTDTLDLFIGGSISEQTDTSIVVALQTNSSGVSSLAGQSLPGNLPLITFDTGFKPNALFTFTPDESGGIAGYTNGGVPFDINTTFTDLSGSGDVAPAVSGGLNNALVNTAVGTSAMPDFDDATTGLELEIPLSTLGYTPGQSIEALAFPGVGSDTRTDNQILAPFVYNPLDTSGGGDYTYIDDKENGVPNSGRQFTGVDYPGDQYFTIPGTAVPEPASLSVLGVAGLGLLGRRRRAAQA